MDVLEKQTIQQLIDNQMIMINKLENISNLLSNLVNTIIKYDNEYQNQIAAGETNE